MYKYIEDSGGYTVIGWEKPVVDAHVIEVCFRKTRKAKFVLMLMEKEEFSENTILECIKFLVWFVYCICIYF